MHLLSQEATENELKDLGREPLDPSFTLETFLQEASSKRGRVKTTLTDQQFIAGIGNRYSDEICFHSRILPMKNMNELTAEQVKQLFLSIQHILKEASNRGGYMSELFFVGDQRTGGYVPHFKVYNRKGEKCDRCGATIIREKISSRKTFFCPGCQN
ncbi:zinc finger domain-containing protein [Bacillaceae bacterium S4-13-58]